jgi:hypothetical protein
MSTSPSAARAPATPAELELALANVEQRLAALQGALMRNDPGTIESVATELQHALVNAIERFGRATRSGGAPAPLRKRLALASAQVAAQRESLACATAALDRAIDVLMPGLAAARTLYSAAGTSELNLRGGSLSA